MCLRQKGEKEVDKEESKDKGNTLSREQMSDKESYFHPFMKIEPPQPEMLLKVALYLSTLWRWRQSLSVFSRGTNPVQTFPLAWVRISAWAERGLTCIVVETVLPTLKLPLQGPWRDSLPSKKEL